MHASVRGPFLFLLGVALWTVATNAQIGRGTSVSLPATRPAIDETRAVQIGPPGGDSQFVEMSPSDPTRVWSEASLGGLYKKYLSGGNNWTRPMTGLPDVFVSGVAIDNSNPNIVYAGLNSQGKGVYFTVNGGETWGPMQSFVGPSTLVNTLVLDPSNSNRLFVGTSGGTYLNTAVLTNSSFALVNSTPFRTMSFTADNPLVVWGASTGTLRRSLTGGVFNSWTTLSTSGVTGTYNAIAADRHNTSILWAATTAGLFRTTAAGTSSPWQNRGSSISGAVSFFDVAIHPVTDAVYTVYLGGAGTVAKTVNDGTSWQDISPPCVCVPHDIDIGPDGRLWLATTVGNFTSTTDGAQWQLIDAGYYATLVAEVKAIKGGALLASGDLGKNLYRVSSTNPSTFTPMNNPASALIRSIEVLPAEDPATGPTLDVTRIFVGSGTGGVHYTNSTVDTPTWSKLTSLTSTFQTETVLVDPQSPNQLWISGSYNNSTIPVGQSNIYSADFADLANPVLTARPVVDDNNLLFDRVVPWNHPLRAYIAVFGGVFKTLDGGATYTKTPGLSTSSVIQRLALNPLDDQNLFALQTSPTNIIMRTVDGGGSWQTPVWPLGASAISVAVDPVVPDTIWAGDTRGGLIKSTDNGLSYNRVSGPFDGVRVFDMSVTPQGEMYFATNNGLFAVFNPAVAPTITTHPTAQVVNAGQTATFFCEAGGSGPLTFAWETATGPNTAIDVPTSLFTMSGTTSTLTLPNVQAGDMLSDYRCRVSGPGGTFKSNNAPLVVNNALADRVFINYNYFKPPSLTLPGAHATSPIVSPAQPVTVRAGRSGIHAWTATSNQPWAVVTGGSGTTTGTFTVAIDPATAPSSNATATITVTEGSVPLTQTVAVNLAVTTTSAQPFGFLDTPSEGVTVDGSVPITGWAVDDVGVQRVEIWRNCVETVDRAAGACRAVTTGGPPNFVFVGNGNFVAGARSDIEAANPNAPQANRAGWGYLLLSNFFPHVAQASPQGGQGTFTIHAYAIDLENNYTLLGSRTVNVDNDHATTPFGAIDTPEQGGSVTTSPYINFGWAMAPGSNCIDTASTAGYKVLIDSVERPLRPSGSTQNWVSGATRPDLAAAFPGLCNTNNALAAYFIDTNELGLATGTHSIAWLVFDLAGHGSGIGSRFFNVAIGSSLTQSARATPEIDRIVSKARKDLPPASGAVNAAIGYSDLTFTELPPSQTGERVVQVPMLGRVVLDFGGSLDGAYEDVLGQRRELPVGVTFDAAGGRFYWAPPIAFRGDFKVVFQAGDRAIPVTIRVK